MSEPMTPEERAEAIDCVPVGPLPDPDEWNDHVRAQIAAAIRAAVEAEREACAEIASGFREDFHRGRDDRDPSDVARNIAAEIRARGRSGQ